jgi:2,3-bisphosphoglycerate-dependent phosphoglycerate mutase
MTRGMPRWPRTSTANSSIDDAACLHCPAATGEAEQEELLMMSRLLLVRHCESLGQHAEAALTEVGYTQAQALAEALVAQPIDHLVSSAYRRARETLAPLAARTGLALHHDERLVERLLAPAPIEGWRDVVRRSFVDPDFRVPGGESGSEVLERAWKALHEIFARGHSLPAVASHGQLIALVLHSIDPSFGFEGWESLSNPDVYLIERSARASFAFRRLAPFQAP